MSFPVCRFVCSVRNRVRPLAVVVVVSLLASACLRDDAADVAPTTTPVTSAVDVQSTAPPTATSPSRATSTRDPTSTATPQPAATATPASIPDDQRVDLPHVELTYAIVAQVIDFDAGLVEAAATVRVTSREAAPLERLFFRVPPARDGFFTLAALTRDGQPLTAVPSDGGTTLEAPLVPALVPGETTELRFDFVLAVGASEDAFASTQRDGPVLRLGYWYPMLSNDEGYPPILDPPYTLAADFDVTFSVPPGVIVATSGPAQPAGAADGRYHWRIEQARDVALMLSRDYIAEQHALGDGTVVQLYTIPSLYGDGDAQARQERRAQALATARRAFTEYERNLGPYPWPTLTIAEGGPSLGGGIEYTALTIITFDALWLEVLVAHEIAHMWFYAAIGTRTQADPWIDEGAATFLSEGMLGGYERFGRDPNADYAARLGPSVYELQELAANDWIVAVYAQGAAFYGDVYNALGPDRFWSAMREVYATQRFGILTPWELLTTFQQHAETDLEPIYGAYFTYAWIVGIGDRE
jgi:hypothetical protein